MGPQPANGCKGIGKVGIGRNPDGLAALEVEAGGGGKPSGKGIRVAEAGGGSYCDPGVGGRIFFIYESSAGRENSSGCEVGAGGRRAVCNGGPKNAKIGRRPPNDRYAAR